MGADFGVELIFDDVGGPNLAPLGVCYVEVSFSADQAAAQFAHKVHLVKGIRNYFNLHHKIFVLK